MNILIVSPIIPSPIWGAGSRNYYLLKALARQHSVSLLALSEFNKEDVLSSVSQIEDFVQSVQIISLPAVTSKRWRQLQDIFQKRPYRLRLTTLNEMQIAINEACARTSYDLVFFESVLMSDYHLPKSVKVVIDQHNIEFELSMRTFEQETSLIRKAYGWLEASRLKPIELELCRRADLVLTTSERERLTLQKLLPEGHFKTISNGVDLEKFRPMDDVEEIPGRIVFTGSMEYYPNIQAVHYFAQKCWPLICERIPSASWCIVGRNPPPDIWKLASLPNVTVTGSVPDTRPYLAEASVVIVPLLVGSGTRLKILEAWAMSKAIVTTSIGYEGLDAIPAKHLVVADKPETFVDEVVTLMKDFEQRALLGKDGRALVEAEYSWRRSEALLLEAIEHLSLTSTTLQENILEHK